MLNRELYFCLNLTSDEHDIVEQDIRSKCDELEIEMVYYRKLKEGHVACFRECKVRSPEKGRINKFSCWMSDSKLTDNMVQNPHSQYNKLIKHGKESEAVDLCFRFHTFLNKKG